MSETQRFEAIVVHYTSRQSAETELNLLSRQGWIIRTSSLIHTTTKLGDFEMVVCLQRPLP